MPIFVKRSATVLTGLILALALITSNGLAATWYGATGLFRVPTADILHEGTVRIGGHSMSGASAASIGYGMFEGIEIAVVQLNGAGESRLTGALKGRVFTETESRPAVATGFVDGSVYGVMSKQLVPRMRAHLGAGTTQGVFAGVSYMVNPVVVTRPGQLVVPRITLLAEYERDAIHLGTHLTFTDQLEGYLTWVDFDRVAVGASWQF